MKKILIPILAIQRNMDDLTAYLESVEGNFDTMNFDGERGQHLARTVNRIAQKVNVSRGVSDSINTHVGVGSNAVITQLIVGSYGDLNIVVTRNSANIALDLPYVLFGENDRESGFSNTLRAFIPAGVTLAVSVVTGNIRLTYTQGMAVDTIDISLTSGNTSYVSFMQALNQNQFKTKYILYTISDATIQTQFSRIISFGDTSALGGVSSNQLSPSSRKMTWDFQDDRVNLLFPEQTITPQFAFVQMIRPTAGFEIGWNVFMSYRRNLNKV
jgi:hypothetical protein